VTTHARDSHRRLVEDMARPELDSASKVA
jgi:hypothetical protein